MQIIGQSEVMVLTAASRGHPHIKMLRTCPPTAQLTSPHRTVHRTGFMGPKAVAGWPRQLWPGRASVWGSPSGPSWSGTSVSRHLRDWGSGLLGGGHWSGLSEVPVFAPMAERAPSTVHWRDRAECRISGCTVLSPAITRTRRCRVEMASPRQMVDQTRRRSARRAEGRRARRAAAAPAGRCS